MVLAWQVMALLCFGDYKLTPSTPKSLSLLMTLSLGFSGLAALLDLAQGAVVIAVAVLPSRGELPRMLSWHCD